MGTYMKKVVPGCLGSSFGVTMVELLRHIGVWGIGDFLFTFTVTFIVTILILTVCIWLWAKVKENKRKKNGA